MSIKLRIIDTDKSLKVKVDRELTKAVKKVINKNNKRVQNEIRASVYSWVLESPEVQSLSADGQQNSLHAQFGLFKGTGDAVADQIAQAITESVFIETELTKNLSTLTVNIFIQPVDFLNLLEIPLGEVRTKLGQVLPWMNWLLFEGSKTIISAYSYEPGTGGRSGGGLMTGGGVWRIPPQYAGTANNNFVTRIFTKREKQIRRILRGLLA